MGGKLAIPKVMILIQFELFFFSFLAFFTVRRMCLRVQETVPLSFLYSVARSKRADDELNQTSCDIDRWLSKLVADRCIIVRIIFFRFFFRDALIIEDYRKSKATEIMGLEGRVRPAQHLLGGFRNNICYLGQRVDHSLVLVRLLIYRRS